MDENKRLPAMEEVYIVSSSEADEPRLGTFDEDFPAFEADEIWPLNDWIDQAIELGGYQSDRQFALALDTSPATIHNWRKGRVLPSEKLMTQLANAGGLDPEEALMHLYYWRAEEAKDDFLKSVHLKMLGAIRHLKGPYFGDGWTRTIKAALLAVLIGFGITGTQPAQADMGGKNYCILWKIIKSAFLYS